MFSNIEIKVCYSDFIFCMYMHTYVPACICAYMHTTFARMTVGCGVIHNSDVIQQSVVNKACVFAGSKHKNIYVMQYLMCTAENHT